MTNPDEVAAGRPVLLRGGTVLTMDDAHTILAEADVLVTGDRIAAVGPRLEAPDGALEIDASGGIVMPGVIDTHRHMWQTAMRAYGADWTLEIGRAAWRGRGEISVVAGSFKKKK